MGGTRLTRFLFVEGRSNQMFKRWCIPRSKDFSSDTGTRTLVWNVRGSCDNHLHYIGCCYTCSSHQNSWFLVFYYVTDFICSTTINYHRPSYINYNSSSFILATPTVLCQPVFSSHHPPSHKGEDPIGDRHWPNNMIVNWLSEIVW